MSAQSQAGGRPAGPEMTPGRDLHRDHVTGDQTERDWEALRDSSDFRALMSAKARFIWPATIFFLVFYFMLPLGIAFAPDLMRTNVAGHFNVAYLFALLEFVMTWVIVFLYIRRADSVFDRLAEAVRRLAAGKERS